MGDQSSEDWLPPGWTVETKVRKNGKKDKHYYGPSGVKLYSKVEVLRYLSKNGSSSTQSKEKQNGVPEHPSRDSGRSINNVQRSSARSQKEKKVSHQASTKDISSHLNNVEGGFPPCKEEEKVCVEELLKDICSYVDTLEDSTVESQEEKKESPKEDAEEEEICGSFNSGACSPNQIKATEQVVPETSANDVASSRKRKQGSSARSRKKESPEKSEMDICSDTIKSSSPCLEEKKRASLPPMKESKKARLNQSAKNVEVEKVVAEGLPPGWIKEIKITRKNGSVRRDLYLTDPATGYIFRSMKDALRYIETGDIGRLAIKPKDKHSNDLELEDAKPDPTVSGLNEIITTDEQSSEKKVPLIDEKLTSTSGLNGMRAADKESVEKKVAATDEQMFGSAQTEGMMELDSTPDQCKQVVAADELNLSKSRGLKQNEGKSSFGGSDDVSTPGWRAGDRVSMDMDATSLQLLESKDSMQNVECSSDVLTPEGVLPEAQPLEKSAASGDKGSQHGLRRSRKKNNLTLPRRSSRRLAGVAVDPSPEIPNVRGPRNVVKQTDEEEMSHTVDISPTLPESKRMDPPEVSPQISCLRREETSLDVNEGNCLSKDVPAAKEGVGNEMLEAESKNGPDEKPPLPFDLPSGEILADPCIEFAIKTLTAVDFEAPEGTTKPTDSQDPCPDAHPRKALSEKGEIDKEADKKQGCGVTAASGKPSTPAKNAGRVSSEETGNQTPGSSISVPFGDTWADPCIEFAIKTLTGAIPVEDDLDINDLMQQQMRSSQIQESNDLNFSSGSLDNFCRTDLLWQHSDAADKATYKQQSGVGPTVPPTGNVDLRSSGGALLHQRCPDRTRKFQR